MTHKTQSLLFKVLFFSVFGVATEVVFTAFQNLANGTPLCDKSLGSMAGMTYVWMFPIYALIPIIGGFLFDKMKDKNIVIRLLFYVFLIYVVEFVSGYILTKVTGTCPWEYKTGLHIMGLIRLDYFPAWAFFCWLIEWLYRYIDTMQKQQIA